MVAMMPYYLARRPDDQYCMSAYRTRTLHGDIGVLSLTFLVLTLDKLSRLSDHPIKTCFSPSTQDGNLILVVSHKGFDVLSRPIREAGGQLGCQRWLSSFFGVKLVIL